MNLAKYVSVIIASTIKFIGGPLTGATLGLSWIETSLCTVAGMMLSVAAITYAGSAIQALVDRYRKQRPKRFTRRTRMAIRVWKRFGLMGIAFLTPLILTPIGGTALAVSFRVSRGQLLLYMLISGFLWAVVQTLAIYQIPGLKGLIAR
ncbi:MULTISPECIES: hypothetical protein [Spirosoma]|uniref:Small multi-drug export protein n=1 Tax=Spirosoma liriopis TaxID=2937440 RepID=A0ABT0HKD5_9BACT|nr:MULTISPECIES: hypothetical protein [Spirosoma]MCK8492065.1 hypothetical protein [Spirosoma liriopis]UHG91486.1 hypothetical protein LQ777_00975 [Spirosoma oryzicola]